MKLRYALGDLVKMVGWYENKPVISVLGRKDVCVRHPSYIVNESEFISCMRGINLDMPYLFFLDIYTGASTKIGVFVECAQAMSEQQKRDIARNVHNKLMNLNQNYALENVGTENSDSKVNVYAVEENTFMDWTIVKMNKIGIKTSNQIKQPRVALSNELIQYFLRKVK